MATCPPDSLDCLLREILTAQSGYNWNPLTFGATVAIGILALAVAMTTVFQGALSAGPGRLKASRHAIGPAHYKKSRTKFSWRELRFRTTAWVPYIDSIRWFDRRGLVQHKTRRLFEKHASYGAGWLNLINSIPAECHHWATTRCQTDYLPSDIQAAPARATIQAVVELAVLTSCDSVTLIRDLPLARGHGSQLSFRDHPYLGIVAVFDQYMIDDHKRSGTDGSKITFSTFRPDLDVRKCHTLYLAAQFSFQGFFMEALLFDGRTSSKFSLNSISVIEALKKLASPQGELAPHELHSVEMGLIPGTLKSLGLGLMTWDSPDNCNGLPYSKLQIRSSLMRLCRVDQFWNGCNGEGILGSLHALLQRRSNHMAYDKYGASRSDFDGELRHPNLGWTWLTSGRSGYSSSSGPGDLRHDAPSDQATECLFGWRHGPRVFQGKLCWFDWRPGGPSDVPMAVSADDGNLVVLPSVLDRCLEWLRREDLFEELSSDERQDARSAIGHQIHEVDYWLLHQGSTESAAQVFGILKDFVETSLPAVVEPLRIDSGSRIPPVEVRSASPDILRSKRSFERRRPPSISPMARVGASVNSRQRKTSNNSCSSGFSFTDTVLDSPDASPGTDVRRTNVRRKIQKQKSHATGTQLDRRRGEQGPREQTHPIPQRREATERIYERRWYRGRVGNVIYPYEQLAPRKDTAELLEQSGKLLDVLEELPSIEVLDQMVSHKGYLCTLDQCHKAFDLAYDLRDHCCEEHHYLEADWAADSLPVLKYDENLASAFEWNTNTEGQLVGRMTRRQEADEIAHEIACNLEEVGLVESDFQDFLEEAQWCWMTELEQQKRRILDTYLLPPPFPSRSSIHSDYITRIFEAKQYRFFWTVRRQWSTIQKRVDRILQDFPGRRKDGSTAPPEGTYSPPPRTVVLRQARRDLVRYHGVAGGGEEPTVVKAGSNKNDGALITYRDEGEEEGTHERQKHETPEKSLVIHPGARERRRRRQRSLERYTEDSQSGPDQRIAIRRSKRKHRRSQRSSQDDAHGADHLLAPLGLTFPAPKDRPSSPSSQIIRGQTSAADKGMRTLLIYRAVLFTALCALAADTSCVNETELGRRVVQVL